jgi:hypothetical protein
MRNSVLEFCFLIKANKCIHTIVETKRRLGKSGLGKKEDEGEGDEREGGEGEGM